MKKVLVTGAAGIVGIQTLKSLLTEGKYEISTIDLPSSHNKDVLKKYKKRINTIYGDLTDQRLVEDLVKEFDIIIHLATTLPVITGINEKLAKITELSVTENIVRAISYYNPNCHLIFASTTSVYGESIKGCRVNSKIDKNSDNYYVKYKIECENLIENKIKNYTIVRIPLVLSKITEEKTIYNLKLDSMISTITKEDAGYLFAKVVDNIKIYNQSIINGSGNESFNILYRDLIVELIKCNATNFRMFSALLFVDKNYYSPIVKDSDKFNDFLSYQNDNLGNYLSRIKYSNRKRYISKYVGKDIIWLLERKK